MLIAEVQDTGVAAAISAPTDPARVIDGVGRLPSAPLAMPKQRLEMPRRGLTGLLARFARGPRLAPDAARRSGR